MDSKCPDRWHLEIDGQVLAYRLGIDFGMKVAGWFEWINGQWRSTNGTAEASPSDVKTVLLVDGFRQAFLNGDYVAKTSLDWYRRHARCSQNSGNSRIWVNQRFTGHETMPGFTNMFSHVSDAEAPFDRWHLETRGFGCNAYLCDVDPTAKDAKGNWKETIFSPTDQLILKLTFRVFHCTPVHASGLAVMLVKLIMLRRITRNISLNALRPTSALRGFGTTIFPTSMKN